MAILGMSIGTASTQLTEQVLLNTQSFIGALSVIFLPFAALVEERKEAVYNLSENISRLEGALEKISAEDKAKSEFIAVLAHGLRNPLSPILSGLELLKLRDKDPHDQDVLQMMGAHTHTIARLLDDLLVFSRISQKKFKLQKEPVKLQSVIEQTLEMVRPYITQRQHTLEVILPEEEVWLNADAVRLTQIFANLLNNSAKYTDPGGYIRLSALREDGFVAVRVKDTGIGIAPERLVSILNLRKP